MYGGVLENSKQYFNYSREIHVHQNQIFNCFRGPVHPPVQGYRAPVLLPPSPDMFTLVQLHYEAWTVGKRVVGIRLNCLLATTVYVPWVKFVTWTETMLSKWTNVPTKFESNLANSLCDAVTRKYLNRDIPRGKDDTLMSISFQRKLIQVRS